MTVACQCRSVWTLKKHFPKVKVYTRAYDVDHGLSLEKVVAAGSAGVLAHSISAGIMREACQLPTPVK